MMLEVTTILFYGQLVLIGIIAYLLGSVNSSIIVGKFYKIDIREHGSGNAGLTNTLRTLGKKAAAFVLIGDVLKGVLAILIARLLAPTLVVNTFNMNGHIIAVEKQFTDLAMQIAGILVILGHIFPVFYKFKGGKGVLTSITVIMMVSWQVGLACLLVFVVVVALTRYVSLGSVLAAFSFPFLIVAMDQYTEMMQDFSWLIFAVILATLVIFMHRGNIARLYNNTERKLGEKKEDYEKRILKAY